VLSRWRPRTTERFILFCTGLLVLDAIVGLTFFTRCINAGEGCSTTNEWIDTVTFALGVLLIGLIACGSVVRGIERYRSGGRHPDPH
jgi:hypothetical protein